MLRPGKWLDGRLLKSVWMTKHSYFYETIEIRNKHEPDIGFSPSSYLDIGDDDGIQNNRQPYISVHWSD